MVHAVAELEAQLPTSRDSHDLRGVGSVDVAGRSGGVDPGEGLDRTGLADCTRRGLVAAQENLENV